MSLLVELPSALFATITTEWLLSVQLAKLDTACCNNTLRLQLLDELMLLPPIRDISYGTAAVYKRYSRATYQWFYSRRIKLQTFYVPYWNPDETLQFINFPVILFLKCEYAYSNLKHAVVNACFNLQELDVCLSQIEGINSSILINLLKIELAETEDVRAKERRSALKKVAQHCKNLKILSIKLRSRTSIEVESYITKLLQENANLTEFECSGTKESLTKLIDNFPYISKVKFTMHKDSMTVPILCKILSRTNMPFQKVYIQGNGTFEYKSGALALHSIHLSETDLKSLVESASDLKSLEMSNVDCNIVPAINQISNTLTSLTVDTIRDNYASMSVCLAMCPQLTEFKLLNGYNRVDDISELFQNDITSLTTFYLNLLINLSTIPQILQKCPNLRSFHVSKAFPDTLSIDDFDNIVKAHKALKDVNIPYEVHLYKTYTYDGVNSSNK